MTKERPPQQYFGMRTGGFPLAAGFLRPETDASEHTACWQAFAQELDYLSRTLRRLGVSESDVEDLAHEIFLILCRNWARYDPTRPLRSYLFGIAFRVSAAHKRQRRREMPSDSLAESPIATPLQDDQLETAEARALVLRALEAIPLKRRAVLILHDLDEIPMRDIAATLAIPVFTAYSRLRKARKELQAAIESIRETRRRP